MGADGRTGHDSGRWVEMLEGIAREVSRAERWQFRSA
jgi:hypothetical protein